jgi:hypothetical protein
MFPKIDVIRREREANFWLLTIILALLTSATVAGMIYYFSTRR